MIQGPCHMLPFSSAGKPYRFFPDDYKENLCCKSSPTGFLHLQASTQHNFFSWSKPSVCFTPKAVSVLLRGCFLQLEERQQISPPPKPQGLNVIAQNKAAQGHTPACRSCTYCADPTDTFLCLPTSNYASRSPSTAWPGYRFTLGTALHML